MTIKRKTFFFAIVFTVAATLGVSMGVYAIVQALSLKFNMSVYLKPDIIFAMDLEVDATGDGVYENGPYCIFNNQDQTKMEAWATVSQNKIVLNRTVPGSEGFNPVQNLTSASVFKITVTNLTQNPTGETNVLAVGLDETAGFITTHELGVQNIHYGNSDTFAFNACLALTGGYYDIPLFANLSSAPVMTVYQNFDTTNKPTDWVKVGYNATLSATATKVETNSFDTLAEHLDSKDVYGNVTSYAYGEDQYSLYAPIYKDIDLVNVDLATGEIIGKLSDTNYDFEWYGGSVTLPSGTTLPSGRTLTEQTTFANVDVYTYYPTMYMKRWVENNRQYISLADWEFEGSIKVDEFYTGTFEATTYNPNKTIATNANGVIPRSYLYDWRPLTSTTITHQSTYYASSNFESSDAAKASTTQAQMLTWSSNLTKAWNDGEADLASTYKKATGVQGENWTRYIYNNLYLIKYADNHSQDTVGYGNTYAGSAYSGKTITYPNGTSVTCTAWADYCTAAETGSGTIGVYDTSKVAADNAREKTIASDADKYNIAGLAYGHNYTGYTENGKTGVYSNQFLTENYKGVKTVLHDGYAGSDKYTSVFCLGLCNPWGNVWTWIFGTAVISNGANTPSLEMYIKASTSNGTLQFDDYNYAASATTGDSGNYVTTTASGYDTNKTYLTSRGYVQVGSGEAFDLPEENGYYTHFGVAETTDETQILSLIGMPSASATASAGSGLTDYYYCNTSAGNRYGVLVGGHANNSAHAGAF